MEWLEPGRAGRFHAGPLLHRAFDLRQLHANLAPDPGGLEVVDETTGQILGEVAAVGPQGQLALGGRDRQVVRSGEGKLFVKGRGAEAGSARFAPRGQPVMSRRLARSLAQYLALPPGPLWMVEHPRGYP